MSRLGKIGLTAINLACLIVTLMYPSDVTALSILPVIVTACVWLSDTVRREGMNIGKVFYIVFAALASISCIVIGLTSTVHSDNSTLSGYSIIFNKNVAFYGGKTIAYEIFAFSAVAVDLALAIVEIVATGSHRMGMTKTFEDKLYWKRG